MVFPGPAPDSLCLESIATTQVQATRPLSIVIEDV